MVENIIFASMLISLLALSIVFIRFLRGPSVLNRVVAFDVSSIISISVIVILAHLFERFIYVDVAIVYGLLSFLGVLVVARCYERGL